MMNRRLHVAIVQASPVYLNLQASLQKALEGIHAAASSGASLVVLGETWLPGYPAWLDYCPGAGLWNHEPTKEVFAQLRQNSIAIPGPESKTFGEMCRDLKVTLVLGVNERVERGPGNGTLYNSLLFIGPDGEILNHHRKLIPTYTERIVWGQGDSRGLKTVDLSGAKLGGLICWEHWMPLTRQALHTAGEDVHVAVWPTVHEMHQVASRHYAFEGRCFVLAAGQLMKAMDLPPGLSPPGSAKASPETFVLRGGSAIIGPDGYYLHEPVFEKETILTATLDLTAIDKEKMTLDVSGHYSRPDIFDFRVRKPRIR